MSTSAPGIREQLQRAAAEGLHQLYQLQLPAEQLVVQRTAADHVGDFTLVLFPLLKHKLGTPEALGQALGDYLAAYLPAVAGFSVVKGFLNLRLRETFWTGFLHEFLQAPQQFLQPGLHAGKSVMVEFSSPNTNKPLHLGHLRNNFLGDSLSRILEAVGYQVVRSCVVNDRGIHICKSMLMWQRLGGGTPEAEGMKGDHLVGKYYVAYDRLYKEQVAALVAQGLDEDTAKKQAPIQLEVQAMLRQWEAGDPDVKALWARMNSWVYQGWADTYRRMGIGFDIEYHESETYLLGKDIIAEGLAAGVFQRRADGAVFADLRDAGLDEKIVLRADGTSVYITQDLGTADRKRDDMQARTGRMDGSIYVVGNEQDYHFKVLFELLRRLGRDYAPGLYHLSYGMVELPSGKMKTREGTVVDADDLMAEVVREAQRETAERGKIEGLSPAELAELHETLGIGAVKFHLLKVSPSKKMLFDPNESVSLQGDTGPFVQYTHARIHSLLARAAQQGAAPAAALSAALLPVEQALLARLYQYPVTLGEAADSHNPSVLATYLLDLAKDYNRFYNEVPVLKESDAAMVAQRLALSQATASALAAGMALLGIRVPNRM